uniref:G protein-coupled receptor n=1 Tax=Heterorhabditis bacteriophora TaxID=37862 RepID=A0A1I7W982_HETBA
MCLLFQMYDKKPRLAAPIGNVVRTAEECRPRPYIKSREYPQLYSHPCNRSERSSLFLLYIHFILLCTYIVSTVTRFVVHFLFIVNKGTRQHARNKLGSSKRTRTPTPGAELLHGASALRRSRKASKVFAFLHALICSFVWLIQSRLTATLRSISWTLFIFTFLAL